MKKLFCVICGKYRKFEKPKISNIIEKTYIIVFSIICSHCTNADENIIKEEESIEISNTLGLIENIITLKIWWKKT